MATLTKLDLKNTITRKLGITHLDASKIVDLFFEEIMAALEKGETVSIAGLGVFKTRHKNARAARNPKTGEPAMITERTVATFNVGTKLMKRLSGVTQSENHK